MKKQRGFIALITVIIISAILLAVAAAIGGASVISRLNIAQGENSQQSEYLAGACGYKALLNLAYDKNYSGNETIQIGTDACSIDPIPPPFQNKTSIHVRSQISKSLTEISIMADSTNLSIISWQRTP